MPPNFERFEPRRPQLAAFPRGTLNRMASVPGYKAKYDYVELLVECRNDHWRLILADPKHGERIEHDDHFETPARAQDAALAWARRHIYEKHNDTLLARTALSWSEY